MAVFIDGLFGGVSGRMGNTVYYFQNGKQVSRIMGRVRKPPTIRQLANRQRMKATIEFLRPISQFIQTGFGLEAGLRKLNPHNAAVSYNKAQAMKGNYPDIEIDFTKVLVSKGTMMGLKDPLASLTGNAMDGYAVRFNWDLHVQDLEWPHCNDDVLLLAYFPQVEPDGTGGTAIVEAGACMKLDGARRKQGQDMLALSISPAGRPMEVYIAVVSQDLKMIADSQYLGRIMLP